MVSPTLGFASEENKRRLEMGAPPVEALTADPAPVSAPAAPALPETPAARPATVPGTDIPNNLFSRIGHVLSSVSAGIEGRELPGVAMQRRMLQREQLQVQRLTANVNLMRQGAELLKSVPQGQKADFINEFGKEADKTFPGFSKVFGNLASQGQGPLEAILDVAGELADPIRAISGGDPDKALSLLNNKQFREMALESIDERNKPFVNAKLAIIRQIARSAARNPQAAGLLNMVQRDAQGRDLLNMDNIREINSRIQNPDVRLTASELGTYSRNPELGLSHGIVTPKLQEKALEEQLFPTTSLQITEDLEAGKKVGVVLDKQGNVLRRVELGDEATAFAKLQAERDRAVAAGDIETAAERQALIDKKLAIVDPSGGLVGPEALAAAKGRGRKAGALEAERQFELDKPVDPALLDLTGQPPMTQGEWKKQFKQLPDEKTIRQLKDSEAAVMTGIMAANRAAELVQANPDTIAAGGSLAQIAANLKAHAISMLRATGIEVVAEPTIEEFATTFDEIGVNRGRTAAEASELKSILIDLAYTVARSRETQGQLTNKDLDAAIRTIGSNIADERSFMRVMTSFLRRTEDDFGNRVRVFTGVRPPPLFPKTLPTEGEQLIRREIEKPGSVSLDEFRKAREAGHINDAAIRFVVSERKKAQ